MTFLVDRTALRTKSEMSHIVGGVSVAEKKSRAKIAKIQR